MSKKTLTESSSKIPKHVMRRIPVFTMEQLQTMPNPATLDIPRPVVAKREAERMVLVSLTKKQALQLGPGLPTLETFLPIARGSQLNQLRGTIPFQWSRCEYGPRYGEVTLLAIVNPTRRHLATHGMSPDSAKRLAQLVETAIKKHDRSSAHRVYREARYDSRQTATGPQTRFGT